MVRLQLSLFLLEGVETRFDVLIKEIGNVLAVHELGDGVEAPLVLGELVVLAVIADVHTGAAVVPHELLLREALGGTSHSHRRGLVGHRLRDTGATGSTVSGLGHGHGDAGQHVVLDLAHGQLRVHAGLQKLVASSHLQVTNVVLVDVTHGHQFRAGLASNLLDTRTRVSGELVVSNHVGLIGDHHHLLVGEQRANRLEQSQLRVNGITTLLRDIEEVKHATLKVRQSGNRLHLNRVALLQGAIQNTWGVHHLPSQESVIHVTNEQSLGGERIWLHLHVRASYLVHKRRLADVGVTRQEKRSRVGIKRGQSRNMLTNFLQIA
mmetsp:Transcript_47526/g.83074  ORF Transcript_47526/g.83074 Transcript_47526/m.83074 type:complete len:322 (-) Transcript_47526:501-1466(-)